VDRLGARYEVSQGILRVWYDFIVGDAWEVAVGVGTSLVISAVTHSGEAAQRRYRWVFLPRISSRSYLATASGECGTVADA
jgi:hypothetical protein